MCPASVLAFKMDAENMNFKDYHQKILNEIVSILPICYRQKSFCRIA